MKFLEDTTRLHGVPTEVWVLLKIVFKNQDNIEDFILSRVNIDCGPDIQSPSYGSYGDCPDCKIQRTAAAWCKNCDIAILKDNFRNWTSDNSMIDNFIRHTQINANENMDYLEWIDFDQFELIENTNRRGAFSSIYSAVWMEGPRWNLDEEAEVWTRNSPIKVVLKRLDNSQNISQEFVNQVSNLRRHG